MSNEKRAPTQTTVKVDPSIEIHKSLYPYINYKQGGFAPYADSIKRAVSSFNPFAVQQVPTSDRMAVGSRNGARWYFPDTYPNTIHFDQHWPSHYNPFADTRRTHKYGVKHASGPGDELSLHFNKLPRFCLRTISIYKRCLVANDDNANKCSEEQDNIVSICPNWALDSLRNKQLAFLRLEALQNQKYRRAMEVADYNQGRTVANTTRRSWSDGTASKLRPDSMWIDDRYVDITQAEVDQAKQRVKAKEAARGHHVHDGVHIELYNRVYEKTPEGIPLYP